MNDYVATLYYIPVLAYLFYVYLLPAAEYEDIPAPWKLTAINVSKSATLGRKGIFSFVHFSQLNRCG